VGGTFLGDETSCWVTEAYESTPNLAIPDGVAADVCGSPVSDSITVPDSFSIKDVNVGVQITHSWIGDLNVSVEYDGTPIGLWQRNCDVAPFFDIDTFFDDEGTAQFCNPSGPTPAPGDGNGRIIPLGGTPLSIYDDADAQGDWTLTLEDCYPADAGTLDHWSLEITGSVSLCAPSAIDLKFGSDPNCVKTNSGGVVSVALFSSADFDALVVDPVTAFFGLAAPVRWAYDDVNEDGLHDLVLKFRTREVAWNLGEDCGEVIFEADLFDGTRIFDREYACVPGGYHCETETPCNSPDCLLNGVR
jgi:subtilisin-like proprotein convertase family protein